ncbi:DUF4261 domain-containing protein [Massilia sp. 9096]|uniref:DUF4261 domain-containing protein n=1 Tax=Massilia sp. 9096 TaxID=1500894 RepID=UPI0018CF441B|nr:DUF4261 domain-containing protein [Massilia sp. 9096]
MNEIAPSSQIVLCIPGPWKDPSEFLQRVVDGTEGDYLFAGRVLMHVPTGTAWELEFEGRDARMAHAFASAGPHWRDSPEMARIDTHQSVVYLVEQGGSAQNVQALMLAARAVLDAGGLGVKVESSGIAHSPAAWRNMCSELVLFSAYRAFVLVVTMHGEAYSCGMHTFGLWDVRVADEDSASALQTARAFSHYLFTESPSLEDRQTFSSDAQAPVYRISSGGNVEYEHSLFANPYGTWQLRRIDSENQPSSWMQAVRRRVLGQ